MKLCFNEHQNDEVSLHWNYILGPASLVYIFL